ncbi:MAG: glycine cleavage system aminomethyltransferase GcvT [Prevotella sp.]|nr:glycine cleavage system aminomethyltransferase GcvT [Prevotella sp.]
MSIRQELEKKEKRTCLYDKHLSLGATMVSFGGFDMPLLYQNAGIAPEHTAVREHVGLFDVSHMGEVTVKGNDAERYVQHIFTNDIAGAPVGKIFYGMMCYENGGTVDDLLVYKMGENDFFLVINAANIDKDWAWMQQHSEGFDIDLQNRSDYYGQIAVQGPESEHIVETVLGIPCKEMVFYTCKTQLSTVNCQLLTEEVIISRTGYTGEDGFEIYASHDYIRECWDKLVAAGVQACGLGCRDTLRFEVGLPLYGDELSEDITPVMAGLTMFVKFDKPEFIGKEALLKQKTEGPAKKLVGIELFDKAIPRHGYTVLNMQDEPIGEVTTGYHTLSTDKSVCMALVDAAYTKLDTEVQIQIRKKVFPGKVVKKQFYNKSYKKN